MAKPALVADIGASTIRVALARANGALVSMRSFPLRSDENPETRLAAALLAAKPRPDAAVLAVAGPVDGDQVTMTNFNWSFSQKTLMRSLKLKRMTVVNDFVAVAHALPALRPADLVSLPGGHKNAKGNLLACGPGSGFGVSALIPARRPIAIASEAGHMRLGAATADAARVVAHLVREMGTVVTEHVLSGPGLARLHRILTDRHESAEEIAAAARRGQAEAKATVDMFLRWFGRIAGDLALTFDARGGVYLAGGVSRALAPLVASSGFREAFENHPPYATRLAAIPLYVVVHPAPGLAGAAVLARRLMR
jgi:glucokinase